MTDFQCHVRKAPEPGTMVGSHPQETAGGALIDTKLRVGDAGNLPARPAAESREPAEGSGR